MFVKKNSHRRRKNRSIMFYVVAGLLILEGEKEKGRSGYSIKYRKRKGMREKGVQFLLCSSQ